jgi:RND superfamily putative drug exporter
MTSMSRLLYRLAGLSYRHRRLVLAGWLLVTVAIAKERYDRSRDVRGSIRSGLADSSRVVTAAALIMALVFVAFMITNDPTVKAIAFTLAIGVFLDAFLVRLVLVPALLALGGPVMWHSPR